MGASGWVHVVPYQPDVRRALSDLQRKVFDERDFADNEEEFADVTTLDELVALKETEEFWDFGTHSILDMDSIIDTDRPDAAGAIKPLSRDEAMAMVGTERLERLDFERIRATVDDGSYFPRWSGRYAVLYKDGVPDAIAFWGYSGD